MDWYHLVLFAHLPGVLGFFMGLAVELASMVSARRARTVETVRVEQRQQAAEGAGNQAVHQNVRCNAIQENT